MAEHAIKTRLDSGSPLILSSDPVAGLVDGASPHPMGLRAPLRVALLSREQPQRVAGHYAGEVAAGIDLLLALTADSTGVGLAAAGMDFRAAAITGAAVDLALEAADAVARDIMVAGVLGGAWATDVPREVVEEELELHAKRLFASGAQVIVARALQGDRALEERALPVRLGTRTGLPTVAWLELTDRADETLAEWARICRGLGVMAMLFEVPSADVGRDVLQRIRASSDAVPVPTGFQLSAGGSLEAWCSEAKRLVDEGAVLIGGGRGTTGVHSATLSRALGRT